MEDNKGYVYILTNPSFREDWVKIGKSSRPVNVRSKELDNTAVPLPFEVFATLKTSKYNEAERLVHRYIERFSNLRIRDNREFFNVPPEVALDIFKDVAAMLDDAEIDEVYKTNVMGVDVAGQFNKKSTTPSRTEKRYWLIPSNKRFFDVEGCFREYGEVYWSQHFNFQTGDEVYIYSSNPEGRIKFRASVDKHDMPYSSEMEREAKFNADANDFEKMKLYNRFALFKLINTSTNNRLSLAHLMEHGLKGAPQGAVNLSNVNNCELLKYIQENF